MDDQDNHDRAPAARMKLNSCNDEKAGRNLEIRTTKSQTKDKA